MQTSPGPGAQVSKAKTPESPKRIALYLGAGLLLIYLATWSPNLSFYLSFQRVLTAHASAGPLGILTREPTEVETRSSSWKPTPGIELEIRLPPGELLNVSPQEDGFVASFREGEIRVGRFDEGFLSTLLEDKLAEYNVAPANRLSDTQALARLITETLANYEFSQSSSENNRYAAHLITKLLLFEGGAVERIAWCQRAQGEGAAVLVEYETGEVRLLIVAEGVWKVQVSAEAPPSWKESPADWLPADP